MIAQPQLASFASLGIVLLAAWGLYPHPTHKELTSGAEPVPSLPAAPQPNNAVLWPQGGNPPKPGGRDPQPLASGRLGSTPGTNESALPSGPAAHQSPAGKPSSQPTPTGTRQAIAARPKPTTPSQAFTMAEPGENLADVAERIYGDRSAEADLIRANRDQILESGKAFSRRTILRTPAR